MKIFQKYILPALFGLLIYSTIRLVNDTGSDFKFWERWWGTTAIEILTSILMGYVSFYVLKRMGKGFEKVKHPSLSWKVIFLDFLKVYIFAFIWINLIVMPVVALTDDGLSLMDFVQINIIPVIYILLLFAIWRGNFYLKAHVDAQLKLEKIKTEQLHTELAYLRAQIHPHFLFNALNTIYFEMDESVEAAKVTLEKFSGLMRYQLYGKGDEHISIEKELNHLKNYISLQEKRYTTKLQLTTQWPTNYNPQHLIHPFLMLPLVENAFKYLGGDYHLVIKGMIEANQLIFFIKNSTTEKTQALANTPFSGIGLQNLKRRLELLYPHQHELVITRHPHAFEVKLVVDLKAQLTTQ